MKYSLVNISILWGYFRDLNNLDLPFNSVHKTGRLALQLLAKTSVSWIPVSMTTSKHTASASRRLTVLEMRLQMMVTRFNHRHKVSLYINYSLQSFFWHSSHANSINCFVLFVFLSFSFHDFGELSIQLPVLFSAEIVKMLNFLWNAYIIPEVKGNWYCNVWGI